MRQFILTFCAVTALNNAVVLGRPVEPYSYEKLFKEADLVVIATAIGSKEVADKVNELGADYVGKNTKFEIIHTLKGDVKGASIELLHFKYIGDMRILNAPMLIEFCLESGNETEFARTVGRDLPLFENSTPEYLLFLKRMADGRYKPVSGHVDPVMSIRKISVPPEVEKRRISN